MSGLQSSENMSFILTINQRGCVWHNLLDIFVVQHVYLLIFSEGVVEDVHDHRCIIHHIESIDSAGNVALFPPVQDYVDAAHTAVYDADHSGMLLHNFIDNLQVFLLFN